MVVWLFNIFLWDVDLFDDAKRIKNRIDSKSSEKLREITSLWKSVCTKNTYDITCVHAYVCMHTMYHVHVMYIRFIHIYVPSKVVHIF